MQQNSQHLPPANDDDAGQRGPEPARRARLVLLVSAVVLAAAGLAALLAVLVSAWLGAEVWPGFVTAAYFLLPLGFLLMIVNVVVSVVLRSRS